MTQSWLSSCAKLLTIFLFIGSLVGCGGGDRRYAVSGEVTYDGSPVSEGTIGFVPAQDGEGSAAGADIVDGHYEIPRLEGPTAGSYMVIIYAERSTGRLLQADEGSSEMVEQKAQYIPWIYNEQSKLTADISEDRDNLNFVLEKPKKATRKKRRR